MYVLDIYILDKIPGFIYYLHDITIFTLSQFLLAPIGKNLNQI